MIFFCQFSNAVQPFLELQWNDEKSLKESRTKFCTAAFLNWLYVISTASHFLDTNPSMTVWAISEALSKFRLSKIDNELSPKPSAKYITEKNLLNYVRNQGLYSSFVILS